MNRYLNLNPDPYKADSLLPEMNPAMSIIKKDPEPDKNLLKIWKHQGNHHKKTKLSSFCLNCYLLNRNPDMNPILIQLVGSGTRSKFGKELDL